MLKNRWYEKVKVLERYKSLPKFIYDPIQYMLLKLNSQKEIIAYLEEKGRCPKYLLRIIRCFMVRVFETVRV